jgi:sialate O-acetylesterase
VKGSTQIEFKDVLVGDVWICSGQSNMELPLTNTNNSKSEIATADYPLIRHLKIPNTVAFHPEADTRAGNSWHSANPAHVGSFTAVGYYFAPNLQQELKIPIGLINTSWGGTEVETWTSGDAFSSSDEFKDLYKDIKRVNLDSVTSSSSVNPNKFPSLLFNSMVNPLVLFSTKGVIWYQGERNANAGRSYQYRKAFPLMITDWRNHWKQGDFPFYFVQLSSFNFENGNSQKGSAWAELREAQTMTLSLPNTGMAVTTDIGNAKDIHPRNKRDVGKRLALIALHNTYRKKVEYSGPVYQSMSVKGIEVSLSFSHNDGLRTQGQDGILMGFEIAGEDHHFYKATERISGKQVIISAPEIMIPVAVRYAWADDAGSANLFNKSELPAVPFRTDNWPGITINGKYQIKGK